MVAVAIEGGYLSQKVWPPFKKEPELFLCLITVIQHSLSSEQILLKA